MTIFAEAKPRKPERKRSAGGDNEVERDGLGRPRIIVPCDVCPGTGKVPSLKREGMFNKCQRCAGEGSRKVSYARVTTFIDALEDKKALMAWEARMVLVGVALDTGFLKDVASMNPEDEDVKKLLNRRAEAAKELAGASKKSEHGTFLHELSELVDLGEDLPIDIDPDDFLDIMAYADATKPLLNIVHMEQLVVCDQYRTAGTPDRISRVRDGVTLTAPNGHMFSPDELLITDLKGFSLDTPLATPSGWTTMGAVEVGKQVIGADGKPCTVTEKSEVKWLDCYRVTFDDTTSVVCDAEHLWETTKTYGGETAVRSVLDVRDTLRSAVTGSRQHAVRLAGPLDLPEADLPIDPYVLGVWLGDGKARGSDFTKGVGDGAIADEIRRRGYEVSLWASAESRPTVSTWNVIGLQRELRRTGLFGNKHVPVAYLRASEQQRLDLLRGLMDTDGTYNTARRGVCFTSTDKALARAVQELVLSLGERVHLAEVERSGFGLTVTAYDVKWVPFRHNPFALPRKADQVTVKRGGRNHRRLIVSVEQVPSVPTQCIAVDSDDRMYLAGEAMVPTHNTGRVDYGGLKMAMQLSIYSRSKLYDKATGGRGDLENINQDWGLIMHAPAGANKTDLYWADLNLGWTAVGLAAQVREYRSRGRRALIPVEPVSGVV